MSQLVMNLFSNAVEALTADGGKQGGTVTLATANLTVGAGRAAEETTEIPEALAPGTYVRLSVEDDGCGMDAETLSKIYTPFFSTRFQGRGLGMAAVWGIVQHHEGHIEIHSEEGKGTRVEVFLPAVDPEFRLRPEAPARGTAPGGSETVLVVDGEEVFRSVTHEYLELLGYRVLEARSGGEAARIATEHPGEIHLALLDVDMAAPTSHHIYAQMVEARPQIRVLLSSAGELDENANALLEAGASGCLRKPFGLDVLGLEIRRVLAE
jgi:CheY-like chemotaxis protein